MGFGLHVNTDGPMKIPLVHVIRTAEQTCRKGYIFVLQYLDSLSIVL